MPLVNYEDSDDSSQEDDVTEEPLPSTSGKEAVPSKPESSEGSENKSLFSRLPAPRTGTEQPPNQSSSLSEIKVEKTGPGPIKIFVPSLKHYAEDDEDIEEEKRAKRFKGSQSGTGLKGILPKPKNSSAKPITTSSFIPQSLVRPKTTRITTTITKSSAQTEESSETEEKVNYFFTEEEEVKNHNQVASDVMLSDIEYGPKPEPIPENTSYTSESLEGQSSSNYSLDDITYKKLIASKFGEEAPEDINIIEVDVSKHLSESKDWLKTISEEKEQNYEGLEPSSTARRKHQITYLAVQAKAREVELKNEWARSRQTKTMSRAKYGF